MARGETTDVKTVTRVERLNNSVNGNPRYRMHFDDGTSALTQSDSSCAYDIQNQFVAGVTFELGLTRAGRVWKIRKLEPLEPMGYRKAFRHLETAVDLYLAGGIDRDHLARNLALLHAAAIAGTVAGVSAGSE